MIVYRCPVCADSADITKDEDRWKYEYKYTRQDLLAHLLMGHYKDDLIQYILEDADDPDHPQYKNLDDDVKYYAMDGML